MLQHDGGSRDRCGTRSLPIWHHSWVPFSERLDRGGGPCWLLKLRQMETQRVQIKGILSWLVSWAHCAGTRMCLSCFSSQASKIFPHGTLFQCICPHRPASWAGSRDGSLVSYCVSCTANCNSCFVDQLLQNAPSCSSTELIDDIPFYISDICLEDIQ